ncbi:MAG: adenine phosphoribosyltransferase [Deltaproteobacteria bacterium]|nr:adenine phosphoribosyltransferase [Deltaproteobacteria bacterium]
MATRIRSLIRDVPDFPKPGIVFKDLTPVLLDGAIHRDLCASLAERYRPLAPDVIVGIESRGFIFGAALAVELGVGFVPVRKPGKLPWRTRRQSYALEYGEDMLEVHEDAVGPGARVVIVDDLLATGGTAAAACDLIRGLGAEVLEAAFVVELSFLEGRSRLGAVRCHSIVAF